MARTMHCSFVIIVMLSQTAAKQVSLADNILDERMNENRFYLDDMRHDH